MSLHLRGAAVECLERFGYGAERGRFKLRLDLTSDWKPCSVDQEVNGYLFFESGKDKLTKREEWTPPVKCFAQNTVLWASNHPVPLRPGGYEKLLPLPYIQNKRSKVLKACNCSKLLYFNLDLSPDVNGAVYHYFTRLSAYLRFVRCAGFVDAFNRDF